MTEISHQQLRDAGFSAVESIRSDTALRLLCAFNGVDPEQAPPGWRAHPNASSRQAWERVAVALGSPVLEAAREWAEARKSALLAESVITAAQYDRLARAEAALQKVALT